MDQSYMNVSPGRKLKNMSVFFRNLRGISEQKAVILNQNMVQTRKLRWFFDYMSWFLDDMYDEKSAQIQKTKMFRSAPSKKSRGISEQNSKIEISEKNDCNRIFSTGH